MGNFIVDFLNKIGPRGRITFLPPFDLGSNKLSGVAYGTESTDAVNKGQLDVVAAGNNVRFGKVRLNADGKARVLFKASTPATLLGSQTGPFNLVSVGDGGTIILNPDGAGNQTVTINFAAGYHTGGTSPLTDMTAEVDTKFKIKANGDPSYHTVTCAWAGCSSGALIAAQMQTQIQAIGATYGYSAITVAYNTNKYVITSAKLGTGSSITIARADDHDACDELKIGPDNGTSTAGTGDVADASAATATELANVINTDLAAQSLVASAESGALRLTSETSGYGSSLVMGNSTLKTVLGLAQNATDYGGQGLGYSTDMADANYVVAPALSGTAQASLATKDLSITNPATTGFTIECEGTSATEYVGVIVGGVPA